MDLFLALIFRMWVSFEFYDTHITGKLSLVLLSCEMSLLDDETYAIRKNEFHAIVVSACFNPAPKSQLCYTKFSLEKSSRWHSIPGRFSYFEEKIKINTFYKKNPFLSFKMTWTSKSFSTCFSCDLRRPLTLYLHQVRAWKFQSRTLSLVDLHILKKKNQNKFKNVFFLFFKMTWTSESFSTCFSCGLRRPLHVLHQVWALKLQRQNQIEIFL